MTFYEMLPLLLRGLGVTLLIVLLALPISGLVGFLAGITRLYAGWFLRSVVVVYIEFFRGTSVLIQLYWIYFVLPFLGVSLSAVSAGVLAIGLNIGAYVAEVVRGALLTVPQGQSDAAVALNFSAWQRLRYILLPQALANMLPSLGNLSIELLKATSLVSLITVADLTYQAKALADLTLQVGLIFGTVLLIYFFLAQLLAALFRALEKRVGRGLKRGGLQGG
ncbi:ectoine/hydroxyectoine ABC transporter permease subunit EhuC [Neptuniibacter sp. CAU 1671]|uniref:ectoine/hydroxyectoine ABC transporter permease subunit EhuC n=1 Tax=Neptuniibacter sp. CAU 1671 TaxID=3032593 RepID=UPI0023D9FC86|nr:ectoine/hydroxyectoine ABC transporter permease subunit EhuC [Neptuniibacter sp. CAU 1671]MDF2180453.1 ectoine/hydroxyectoine ABC transporter permease subunit EhuC [Neptuniibacter sp. CAU 1671]